MDELPKNFTGPPSVVLLTESTLTSQYVRLDVKLTSMGKKLSESAAGTHTSSFAPLLEEQNGRQ